MAKPRKHKFVSQCIEAGETTLTVWPEESEVSSQSALKKYLASIDKIAKDPRVIEVMNSDKHEHGVVFTVDPNRNVE